MALMEFESAHDMMTFYRDLRARTNAWAPRPKPPEPEPLPEAPAPAVIALPPPPPLMPLTPIRRIVLAVAQEFEMPVGMLCSRSTVQEVVVPRHVVVFLAKELTNSPQSLIGKAVGHRDHSSVSNSVRSLKAKMLNNPALALRVQRLRHKLLELEEQHDDGCGQDSERARDNGSGGPDAAAPRSLVECRRDGPGNL
jgi:hypothetical protein